MFELRPYLDARRSIVDGELERRLPAPDTRPADLHAAMRYSLFPGGKRVRPVLCLAAAEAVAGIDPVPQTPATPEAALLSALTIELVHNYTLVHDDLPCMDDDRERRGKPTVHVAFGEANAVLTGDALLTLAFEWLSHALPGARYAPGRLVLELSRAIGSEGVVGGQVEDMTAGGSPSEATMHYIHQHKTADLFRAATRMGAIAADATAEELDRLSHYGEALGFAFQIADDLLDEGELTQAAEASSGKAPPATCLSIYGAEEARAQATAHVETALSAVAGFPGKARQPLEAIARYIVERTH